MRKLDVLRKYDVQYNHYLSGGGTFDEESFPEEYQDQDSKAGIHV